MREGTGVDDEAKQRRKQRIGVGVSHAREGLAVPFTRCHATAMLLRVLVSFQLLLRIAHQEPKRGIRELSENPAAPMDVLAACP